MKMTSRMGSSDTAALVTLADQNQTIRGETPDDVRASIISTASAWASAHGEAVYLESTEDGQTWAIQVTPDGSMDEVPVAVANSSNVPAGTASAPQEDLFGVDPVTEPIPVVSSAARATEHRPASPERTPELDASDTAADAGLGILTGRPQATPTGQPGGVDNPFRRPGSRTSPALSQTGSVRVMVANTAGGAGKTPTLIGVAQAMAAQRGGEWVLVDLNPTGNLGDMAGVDHQAPLPDLIEWLHANPNPTRTQLQQHLAWSSRLGCWIITSRETVTGPDGTPIDGPGPSGEDTRRVLAVLAEQFSLIGMDTGNNDLEWAYRVAAETADRLVVATTGSAKSHAGALATVADLWDLGYHDLARQAVVVNMTPRIKLPGMNSRRQGLDGLGLRVVDVPYDRQVAAMRPDRMGRAVQAAYTRVADVLGNNP
ncbi:Protein of unknown function [Propionibacterium freudenreichii subsp. freudenreichii]|nr:Protein of unknown function [Propionibacterium freudenreichii subsp. freudenreichii]